MSLQVTGLAAGYGRMEVLSGVSIEVPSQSIVSVVGANGAGKSTLAKTISGQLRATAGEITVDGTSLGGSRAEQRAQAGLIHVPEGRRLFGQLTVAENIAMGRQAARRRGGDPEVVDQLLESFPVIRERWTQRAGLLSGGEQQMVALTRAAASRPRYLLLDEPSLGLSPRLSAEVLRLVGSIAAETGAGVMLIEQRIDAALRLSSYSYVVDRGRVVAEGPSEQMRASDEIRKAYLGL